MTTVRICIFERHIDVRANTDTEPVMISAGWTAQLVHDDGTVIASSEGLRSCEAASSVGNAMINNYRQSQQQITHALRNCVNERDPLTQ